MGLILAAGVGVTPFLALLEARQRGAAGRRGGSAPVQMHYCTRDAARDPLLARVQALCAQAEPPVELRVYSQAQGQLLQPQDLEGSGGPLDIWFCGPQGLGDALDAHAARRRPWRVHRESFAMR